MKKTLTRSLIVLGAISLLSVPAFAEDEREPQGAEALAGALERDHDGSILDNLGSLEGREEGEGEDEAEEGETEIQGRMYDPNANTASQPERNEGNEDELDINSGDDGSGGGGASQGNGG